MFIQGEKDEIIFSIPFCFPTRGFVNKFYVYSTRNLIRDSRFDRSHFGRDSPVERNLFRDVLINSSIRAFHQLQRSEEFFEFSPELIRRFRSREKQIPIIARIISTNICVMHVSSATRVIFPIRIYDLQNIYSQKGEFHFFFHEYFIVI